MMAEVYMVIGFMMAAYAIVANDSIQTLGTFLYSNSHRRWWVLWLFSSWILVTVILYGWFNYERDPSYSRLNKVYETSVSLDDARAAIDRAFISAAEPEQAMVLEALGTLESQLAETKRVFVQQPHEFHESLADLRVALEPLKEGIAIEGMMHAQIVALSEAIAEVEQVTAQMEVRRDVRDFINWTFLIPPVALMILTRLGFPVSTSFIILITFQPAVFNSMLGKSLMGYAIAAVSGFLVYLIVMRLIEARWRKAGEGGIHPIWVVFQWGSTGFLWSMWLIQDMANIFVYLPRQPGVGWLLFAITWMVGVQGIIYYSHGGKIQKIVTSKSNTHDIRSATIVDIVYGLLLLYFKEINNVPMSTTWVFLGLLAGRELAFAVSRSHDTTLKRAIKLARKDMVKAGFGLAVSVIVAHLINAISIG